MARTRVDPWQSEPDVSWWGSSLSTIIPKTPRSKSPILSSPSPPYEETSYTAPHTKYLTKPSARFLFNSKSIPPPPVDTKNPLSPPFSSTLTATKPAPKPPPKPTHSNVLFPKSRHRSPLLPSSESKNTNGSSPKLKTLFPRNSISKVTKPKSKVDLEIAATKVITACNDLDHCLFETVSPIKPQKEKNRLELPDGDKRKNMVPRIILRDIGGIISKVCPKLSSAPTSPSSSKSTLLDGSLMSVSPPSTPGSPGSPVLTPISLHSPLLQFKRRTPLITLSDIPMVEPDVPQVFLEPPIVTLEEDPPVLKNSVDSAFNSSFKLTSLRQRKSSFSEKSSTPVSKKSLVFEVLEGVAPSPFKSKLESLLPCSPKSGPAYPLGSVSSVSSKSNIQPDNSIDTVADPAQIKILRSSKNSPLKQSPNSVEAQLVSESGNQAATDSTKLKAAPPLENGFFGFPKEDGKRLTKTRFHVDTNILASSLDLLDLQKHAGNISGSPTTCCNCNIIFSSVKHCKYHQSATSPGVFDSLRQHTVQEDGVWLCPWCPVMCTTVDFLHKHKLVCREKGRCQQEEKASSSSFRKSAPSSSRRRTCTPAILTNSTTTLPALLKPSNSFRVVHGFVIPA